MSHVPAKSKSPARRSEPAHGPGRLQKPGGPVRASEMEAAEPPSLSAFYLDGPAVTLASQAGVGSGGNGGSNAGRSGSEGGGSGTAPDLQFNLVIGQTEDAYEQEADTASDRIAAGKPVQRLTPLSRGALSRLPTVLSLDQSKHEETEDEALQAKGDENEQQGSVQPPRVTPSSQSEQPDQEKDQLGMQRQAEEEEKGEAPHELQTSPADGPYLGIESGTEIGNGKDSALKGGLSHPGPGSPIPSGVRQAVEPSLGADLSSVRVHSDSSAEQMARSLRARAFTHGRDIYLGSGESPLDTRLIAHEAAHVVQQEGVSQQPPLQRVALPAPERPTPAGRPEAPTTTSVASAPANVNRDAQLQVVEKRFQHQMEGELQLQPGYLMNPDRSNLGLPPAGEAEARASDALAQISAARERLQIEAESMAAEGPEIQAEAPVPAEAPQDDIAPDAKPESVVAEIEAMRAPVQDASLPIGEVEGPGPESQAALQQLRSMQAIDPRLINLAEVVEERISILRDRTAANALRGGTQLRGEAEAQRAAMRGSMAASQTGVADLMIVSRDQIAESKASAQENLAQQGDEAYAQNAEITASETDRLNDNLAGSVEEGRTIFREADEEVSSTGADEARRGRDYHYDLARRARDMGRREADYYRRTEEDEDLASDKAEAVMEVAERFAGQLQQDGDGLHADVLEQTDEAREQITAEEEPTVQGLADVAPGAVESIQTFLGSVDDGLQQVVQGGVEQLDAAEAGAQNEIEALDLATRGRGEAILGQGESQLDAVLVSGLLSQANLAGQAGEMLDIAGRDTITQIEQVGTGGVYQTPGEPVLVQRQPNGGGEAFASESIEGQDEALGIMDQMGPALDQAADSQTAELTRSLDETTAGANQVCSAWVEETQTRMDSLTDVADTGLTDIADAAGGQLESTLEQGQTQAISEVDRISQEVSNNVDQVRVSVEDGVSDATDSLRGGVDDGITHADEVIGELPSEMHEAAEAQESFFGSIGHWFSEQLAQTWQAIKGMADWGFILDLVVGIVVGVLVTVAVVALLGTGVGAILLAGALAGAAGFAAAQMSANVRNGDPLFHNVGHAAILGGFVGLAAAIGTVAGLGLLAGTGLVMLGAGIGTVVANVATGRQWDDHLLANILIIGVFHAVFKSATDRLPPSWRLPVRRGPQAEEPPGNVPPRAEPRPADTPPAGMSARLTGIRSGLTDPRAIEAFDAKFESLRGDSARMERIIDAMSRGGDLEARLIAEWERANPAPRGEAIDEVPGLRNRAEALRSEIKEYVDRNPSAHKLLSDIRDGIAVLDDMLSGRREATTEAVQGERNNLNGIEAEFRSAQSEPGQPGVGRRFSLDGRPEAVEVDVVSDNGLRWTEIKNTEPFGLESTNWIGGAGKQGARVQAQEMVRSAQQNPVNGQTPQVTWSFPKGVSVEVAAALRAMGITVRGQLANVPPPVTPPPPPVQVPDEETE